MAQEEAEAMELEAEELRLEGINDKEVCGKNSKYILEKLAQWSFRPFFVGKTTCNSDITLRIKIILMRLICSFSFLIKEPKEEEMTEEEKAAQKARPIATNPIPGTPWYIRHLTAHVK